MSLVPAVSYFTFCLRTGDHTSISEAISYIDFIESHLSASHNTRVLRESMAHLTYRVCRAAYSTISPQDKKSMGAKSLEVKDDQEVRFTVALRAIEILIAEATPVLAINDEQMSNVHLDNFLY